MTAQTSTDTPRKVHFLGIGGTGMVAVARLAIEAGWEVRGSDNPLYPPTSGMVKALNIPVAEGYAATNLDWGPDIVIIGNALSRGNEEVEAVLERGIAYCSFPEWLKDAVLRDRSPIVIAGTHGKTTTTTLAAFLLDRAGLNPGYLIGGQPLDFANSSHLGQEGAPFVVEGDEYDTAFFDKRAKFFHYIPQTAVVTSLEFDHADIYQDLDAIISAFRLMLRQIPRTGTLILCADSPNALALHAHAHCNVVTYGFDNEADWRAELLDEKGLNEEFSVYHDGEIWGQFETTLFGRHNLQNILAAIVVAAQHGVTPEAIKSALQKFSGIRRRMEIFLKSDGIVFIDDFAHHPTAIHETIAATRKRWPNEHITVLFEPRSNTTATNTFQYELGQAFKGASEVWIAPIFRADRYEADKILDRDQLIADIATYGAKAHAAPDVGSIVTHIREDSAPHDIVLILSNGAFGGIYDLIRANFTGQTDG